MPDGAQTHPKNRGFGCLTLLDDFFDSCLRQSNGKPLGRRARQKIIRQSGIKVIKLGNGKFIDEEFEANRLREIAQRGEMPRGPGRPRKVVTA